MCKWITTVFFSAPMLSHLVFFAFNVWREVSFERVSTSFFGVGAACNWISNTYSPALSTSTISKFTRFVESNGMECKWNANKKFRSMPLFAAIALTISRYLSSSIAVWAENKQIKWNSEEFSVVLRKKCPVLKFILSAICLHQFPHLFAFVYKMNEKENFTWKRYKLTNWITSEIKRVLFFRTKNWIPEWIAANFPTERKRNWTKCKYVVTNSIWTCFFLHYVKY